MQKLSPRIILKKFSILGGGFVSLLLEKAEKRRSEKDKEKRKLLAEERKLLKEEQDKDVQEWEKNVLLKDHEEEIKSMWEVKKNNSLCLSFSLHDFLFI